MVEYKVGNKVRFLYDVEFPLAGIRFPKGDVVELIENPATGSCYGTSEMLCIKTDTRGLHREYWFCFTYQVELVEEEKKGTKSCQCPITLLMSSGCRCGGT
jgi:hypothetical protein